MFVLTDGKARRQAPWRAHYAPDLRHPVWWARVAPGRSLAQHQMAWQPLRGKWAAPISHNAAFREVGPVATLKLRLVGRPRGTGVMSCAPPRLPSHSVRPGAHGFGQGHGARAAGACTRALPSARSNANPTSTANPLRSALRAPRLTPPTNHAAKKPGRTPSKDQKEDGQ